MIKYHPKEKYQRAVNTFLISDDKLLLGMKKRGHGEGKWNGFGGKVEKGEHIKVAAVREVFEECGIKLVKKNLRKRADLYYFEPDRNWKITVFVANIKYQNPVESEEMKPKWFEVGNIPYNKMWSNDKLWLSEILKGKKINATFWHNKKGEVVKKELKV